MFLLAKLIILTSILVLGYTAASQEGMVLYPIRQWAEKQKGKIWETLLLCHWCQPSTWTVAAYVFIWIIGEGSVHFTFCQILIYPLVVCGSSVLNGLVWATYKAISEIDKNYRMENEWIEAQGNQPVEVQAAEIISKPEIKKKKVIKK